MHTHVHSSTTHGAKTREKSKRHQQMNEQTKRGGDSHSETVSALNRRGILASDANLGT